MSKRSLCSDTNDEVDFPVAADGAGADPAEPSASKRVRTIALPRAKPTPEDEVLSSASGDSNAGDDDDEDAAADLLRAEAEALQKLSAQKDGAGAAVSVAASAGPPAGRRDTTSNHRGILGTSLLPDVDLEWSVIIEQPESFVNMIRLLKHLHMKVTLRPTDKRRLVGKTKDGDDIIVGFRGIAIDAADSGGICLSVARLSDPVTLYPPKTNSDGVRVMDALPSVEDTDECTVTVNIKTLLTLLKNVKANETLAMFALRDEVSYIKLAIADSMGDLTVQTLKALDSPLPDKLEERLVYKYELSVPLDKFKAFVRTAKDLGAVNLSFKLAEDKKKTRLLVLRAEGDDATTLKALVINNVRDLPIGGNQVLEVATGDDNDDESGGGGVGDTISSSDADHDKIAAIQGAEKGVSKSTDPEYPLTEADIVGLSTLYNGTFSTKFLDDTVTNMMGTTQLTLFMYNATDVSPYGSYSPIIMRFDLGKTDSYVAFVLGARSDD